MRVKPAVPSHRPPEPARSFDAAMAKARREREQRRSEPSEPKRRLDPAVRSREAESPRPAEPRGSAATAQPAAGAGAAASTTGWPRNAEPALPELREAARAIPPAIWAGRLEGAPSVELSFGRDLSVELRRSAAGIELSVRAGAALARAARADLPALVQSLRGRGVVVARADVRGEGAGHGVASR